MTLHLRTDEAVGASNDLVIRLKRTAGLVAPQFKLIVRDGGSVAVNQTVAFPTCLYAGHVPNEDTEVAVSTCHNNRLVKTGLPIYAICLYSTVLQFLRIFSRVFY